MASVTTRSGKGSALTHLEMDSNLNNLNTDKLESTDFKTINGESIVGSGDIVLIQDIAPYSGYTQVSKKLDNFVFQEDANFTYSVADKNRYIKFGNEVVDTYGPELVTTLGTIAYSGCSISNQSFNSFTVDATTTASASFYLVVEDGKTYTLNFYSSVATKVSVRNSTEDLVATTSKNKGLISVTFTAKTTTARLYMARDVSIGTYTFDNISVKEIQTADFTNTAPTVTEIITDGSNSTSGAVSKGEYVLDGTGELVTNGTFNSDTDWDKGSGWTIAEGVATHSGNASRFYQIYSDFIVGTEYVLKADLLSASAFTNEAMQIRSADNNTAYNTLVFDSTGTKYLKFTAQAETLSIAFYGTADISIDNISVKRVSDVFRAIDDAPIGTALTDTAYFQDKTKIGVTHQ